MKSVYHDPLGTSYKYTLNHATHCPECDTEVRTLSGKLVDAAKSSPYDGEFDAGFHTQHKCKIDPVPELQKGDAPF